MTPEWAARLVDEVCRAERVAAPPTLRWIRRRRIHSTGVTRRHAGAITVAAGTDALDQRLTLLHELAHWVTPQRSRRRGRVVHHGRAFYATAFRLYLTDGIDEADALRLEGARYPSAIRHAAALGVAGADGMLAARRVARPRRPPRSWRVVVPEHPIRLERDGRWTVCGTCRQRIVGWNLARLRRRGARGRHLLLAAS